MIIVNYYYDDIIILPSQSTFSQTHEILFID